MAKADVRVRKLDAGRTILTDTGGEPQLIGIAMRDASSAPARVKGMFVLDMDEDGVAPLPIVQTECGHGINFGFEFRLEMN